MIEEIKKEISNLTAYSQTSRMRINDSKSYICRDRVYEILDKYKNQEKQTTIFIDTEDMEERYGTQLYIEYLEKYKNAWNELKEDCREVEKANDYILYERLQQLEQKYGI